MSSKPSTSGRARTAAGKRRFAAAARLRATPAADATTNQRHDRLLPIVPFLHRPPTREAVLLQQIVNGLTLGAVYTLVALSFSLVMGILGILNLAIAELFMLGAYFGFAVIAASLPLPLALAAGMAGAGLVAGVIEKIGYAPLRDAPVVTPMLSTLGFSIVLQNVATNVWGSDPLQLPAAMFDLR